MTLMDELRRLPGVEEGPSQWTGAPALWLDGREILHFHGDDVEIRVTRKVDDERAPGRARYSDWVIVPARDEELVRELAAKAVEANRRG
jgi:hypothetical protein